jgi:hypothetical protein
LNCVHVEIRKRAATHLGITDVGAIHREYSLYPALSIDGELLGEVRCPIHVRHGAGGQQQERAEIASVQR